MHRTRSARFPRVLLLTALLGAPGLLAAAAPGVGPGLAAEPPVVEPEPTDEELFCELLKLLGKPCPSSDSLSYEEYYAEVERAWYTCDPNGFTPERRELILAQAMDVRRDQTPAPQGVDLTAHERFTLVLDEIIYEMGG